MRLVHGCEVYGVGVDNETRCGHWHSPLDIIAIKFCCCGRWYPCYDCHQALAAHPPTVWPAASFDEPAVLCGSCGKQLSVNEYLGSGNTCPQCSAGFNPGCAKHYGLYFEM